MVRFATFGLAFLVSGLAFVVGTAPTLGIALTLALFKAGFGCGNRGNRGKPDLSAFKLGGDVQVGFVLFCFVCVGRLLHQCANLGFEFGLCRLHAAIAHGLVAAGIGLDLG